VHFFSRIDLRFNAINKNFDVEDFSVIRILFTVKNILYLCLKTVLVKIFVLNF